MRRWCRRCFFQSKRQAGLTSPVSHTNILSSPVITMITQEFRRLIEHEVRVKKKKKERVNAAEIHRKLSAEYPEERFKVRTVRWWVKEFTDGRESTGVIKSTGRKRTVRTEVNQKRVEQEIVSNPSESPAGKWSQNLASVKLLS